MGDMRAGRAAELERVPPTFGIPFGVSGRTNDERPGLIQSDREIFKGAAQLPSPYPFNAVASRATPS